jgi:pantoate--beta-alanine ligase
VREADGLALSSRNVRLSPKERRAAVVLSRALAVGRSLIEQGAGYSSAVAEAMRQVVEGEPLVRLDYAVAVGRHDLVARELIEDPAEVRLLIAADVGPVRLIDNCAGVEVVAGAAQADLAQADVAERRLQRIG